MHVVLFGASGTIGQRIAREARARGHQVTAVVRHPADVEGVEGVSVVQGDVTDPTGVARVVRGADAVVSAVSPRGGQPFSMLSRAAHALIEGMKQAGLKRLVVVGGAGSLQAPEGGRVMDRPSFPTAWKPFAEAHAEALEVYRREGAGLDWTYISPADLIQPGERTGHYRAGGETLVVDAEGHSHISTEDYAVALVDELEHPAHVGRRFTVGY